MESNATGNLRKEFEHQTTRRPQIHYLDVDNWDTRNAELVY